ncbi:hypothetical protein STAS_22753 [Striga asiatica]|uniref:Uncharacterized protein n=1 Tax=Striga asiatica TaxID=4170 RepID=A0A5A7QLN2_STRAF|nr:hypothetical protein STAS_22753 [Striga asiatica]
MYPSFRPSNPGLISFFSRLAILRIFFSLILPWMFSFLFLCLSSFIFVWVSTLSFHFSAFFSLFLFSLFMLSLINRASSWTFTPMARLAAAFHDSRSATVGFSFFASCFFLTNSSSLAFGSFFFFFFARFPSSSSPNLTFPYSIISSPSSTSSEISPFSPLPPSELLVGYRLRLIILDINRTRSGLVLLQTVAIYAGQTFAVLLLLEEVEGGGGLAVGVKAVAAGELEALVPWLRIGIVARKVESGGNQFNQVVEEFAVLVDGRFEVKIDGGGGGGGGGRRSINHLFK